LESGGSTLQALANDLSHLCDLVDAHERIDLGNKFGQFLAEALGQAAGHD
jgi:hypothetical protein